MSKVNLVNVEGGHNLTKVNENFQAIASELNNNVLYRENFPNEPNAWNVDMDANSKRILNLPKPASLFEPVRLIDMIGGEGTFVEDKSYYPKGSTLQRHYGNKMQESRSVLDFIPEELHDQIFARTITQDVTSYIQAALNAVGQSGGSLYVPAGLYPIMAPESNYLWLTGSSNRKNYAGVFIDSNVTLFGDGAASEFKLIGTPPSPGTTDGRGDYSTTHIVVNRNAQGLPKTIVNENIAVYGILFNGNFIQQSGEGVSFCGVKGFVVNECYFENSYYETNYFVFCRGGEYAFNHCYNNGVYQIDGGGPMCDSSTDVDIHHNVITDSGYYAVLLIDATACTAHHNNINSKTYEASAGYQAIRVAGCVSCEISSNKVWDSGFSAIWVHNGYGNSIKDNLIVHAGYASGGGAAIHGILIDYTIGNQGGRHIVSGNKVYDCKGAGIANLEAVAYGGFQQDNAGSIFTDNICAYNQRDGIAIAGTGHSIHNNVCESNGYSISDGIVGNGYNGIALNGAQYCTVSGNTCSDILQPTPLKLNMDARNNTTYRPQRTVAHTVRTQNYGIVEYPIDTREESPLDAQRMGKNVVVTKTDHTVANGSLIHCYNGYPNDYNGYFVATVTSASQFYYTMIGNPVTFASFAASGDNMSVTTGPHGLGIGEKWVLIIDNGGAQGEWQATIDTSTTAIINNMSSTQSTTGSTTGNFLQYNWGDRPTSPLLYAAATQPSDYNVIKDNNLTRNLVNPTLPGTNGYKKYVRGACNCGANSIVSNNLGQ